MFRALLLAAPLALLLATDAQTRAADENPVIALIKSKVKDTKKPFALLVTFKVKAGEEKKFEAAFAPCLAATRKEPGCVAYYLNRDPDEPNTYIMYEQFKSLAAVEEHLKQKHTEELFKVIPALFDGELKVKVMLVPE